MPRSATSQRALYFLFVFLSTAATGQNAARRNTFFRYSGSFFTFGQPLIGTWWLLVIGYAVISVPTIVRMTRAALFNVNRSLEESAASLGSRPLHTFCRITFPILLPTIVSAGAQAFNAKLVEYTMTSLLYAPKYTPLGIAFKAGSETIDKNSYANNLVYIVVVMLLSILVYALTARLRERQD